MKVLLRDLTGVVLIFTTDSEKRLNKDVDGLDGIAPVDGHL